MRPDRDGAARMIRRLENILDTLVVVGIVALSALVFWQFTSRYMLAASLAWSEEVATYFMIWASMLGLVSLMRRDELIALDSARNWSWRPARVAARLIALVATMAFLALVLVIGLQLSVFASTTSLSSAARIPIRWVYLIFPIMSALVLLRLALRSWRERHKLLQ